ncbi:MAG TPA: magnesium-translocating P-type ATPase [Candidatus Angelobacter sp.]|nr:magnesium-translocating P-type ATPase [Candidatus Angelobacter sp.]
MNRSATAASVSPAADLEGIVAHGPAGLTSDEAAERLRQYGWNEPASEQKHTLLAQCIALFTNPILLILLAASAVAAMLGQIVEASVIVTMVALSAAIDFIQSYRAQVGVDKLKQQVALQATVLRDGNWIDVPRREIVPGDLVRLAAGDLVPADGVLTSGRDLHLQEAALTGESLPIDKEAPLPGETADARHRVYMGTSVVSGTATAVITSTGATTEFGKIAGHLTRGAPDTSFERGLRQFGTLIMKTILLLVLFVFLATSLLHQPTLEAFLFAVALAVGLTPEFLPMITTVTLSQGAMKMAKEHVIVKRLAAIQNFGSIDVLCSDKTGTLTRGEMCLEQHVNIYGESSEEVYVMAYLNSLHQTGVANPVDKAVHHASRRAPLEDAILVHAGSKEDGWNKLDEIPFDFERRRVSVVVERGGQRLLICKGSPETIMPLCVDVRAQGKSAPLDEPGRSAALTQYQNMGEEGLRVLAVAVRCVPQKPAYAKADEKELTLYGFLGFSDPPLPDVAETIQRLREDGIRLKILTGDGDSVARHVCGQVGFPDIAMIKGDELDVSDLPRLRKTVEQYNVFARVTPSQKTFIIEALRHNGHVVGFMGDGINDAPSLRAADVGISVSQAVDVARDAADFLLLQPGLGILHQAIREGRRAFVNVIKYLFMGTSSNFGNMLSMAAASLFLPFLPMTATQILINNFLYDTSQLSIPTDNVDEEMLLKPRRWDMGVLRKFMLGVGPISSVFDFLTFFVLLRVFHAGHAEFRTGWFVESLATQTLVLFVIRTAGNPFRSRPSAALTATILGAVACGILLPYTPLGGYFGFVPLSAPFFAFLTIATVAYLSAVEYAKRLVIRGYLA